MKEWLFSYGTLQKEKVQMELFKRILQGSSDMLRGYKIATIEIKDASFISKGEQQYQQTAVISNDKNDSIKGTVFEMTGEELFLADKYEPGGYQRIRVILKSGKEAWMYVNAQ